MALTLRTISIKQVNPAPYNPRIDLKPGDPEYEKLKRSLKTFGCVEPLVWNKRTGNLVGGHQRFKVLREQGAERVEVSVVDLPLAKEKALNVALNKIQGGWDEERLAVLLQELATIPDFDVGLTGFDRIEIGGLLDRVSGDADAEDGFDLAEALEAADSRPPVTRKGALIELGPHRLLCGDSGRPEHLDKLLADVDGVDLFFTDPPYNVSYYGGNRPQPHKARPKRSRQWKRIYGDDLTQEQYEAWLTPILESVYSRLRPGSPFYIWNGHRQFGPMHAALSKVGAHISCVITWAKECFAIGYGDYNQQSEFCLYGWRPGRSHRWYGPTNESTLWQVRRDCTRSYRHPTQKPIALAARAIKNSSTRGDIVLDTFLGSGTTLIAAERLERRCLGIELDSRYCDAIVRRYLAIAGDSPGLRRLRKRYGMATEAA